MLPAHMANHKDFQQKARGRFTPKTASPYTRFLFTLMVPISTQPVIHETQLHFLKSVQTVHIHVRQARHLRSESLLANVFRVKLGGDFLLD